MFKRLFGQVIGRSIVKALKQTGITVGAAAGLAGAAMLQNPEVMGAIWAATGPFALIAIPVLSFAGQTLYDAVKHRTQG